MESVLLCAGLVDIQLTQADGHGDCLSIPLCSCAPSTHLIKLPVNGSKRVHKQTCGLGRAMKNLTAPKRRSVRAGLFKGSSRPRTSISWLKEDFLTGACVPWMHPQPVGHVLIRGVASCFQTAGPRSEGLSRDTDLLCASGHVTVVLSAVNRGRH